MGGVHPWHPPPSRIDNGFKSVHGLSMISNLLAIIRNSTSKLTLYQQEMVIEEQQRCYPLHPPLICNTMG